MIRELQHCQIVGAERIANIVLPSGNPNPMKFHTGLIQVQVAVEGEDDLVELTISKLSVKLGVAPQHMAFWSMVQRAQGIPCKLGFKCLEVFAF